MSESFFRSPGEPPDVAPRAARLPGDTAAATSDLPVAGGEGIAERLQVFRIHELAPRQAVGVPVLLARVLHRVDGGLTVCDRSGRMIYQNAALKECLAAEAESGRLLEEIEVLARSVFLEVRNRAAQGKEEAETSLVRQMHTAKAGYRLSGVYIGESPSGIEPAVLVTIKPSPPTPLTDGELHVRFGLTPQEVRIAHLIAEGRRNQAIADLLSLSCHTVRHHVRHVLHKLGLHSRGEVASLLAGASADPAAG